MLAAHFRGLFLISEKIQNLIKHTGWHFTVPEWKVIMVLISPEYFLIYTFSITGAILNWNLCLLDSPRNRKMPTSVLDRILNFLTPRHPAAGGGGDGRGLVGDDHSFGRSSVVKYFVSYVLRGPFQFPFLGDVTLFVLWLSQMQVVTLSVFRDVHTRWYVLCQRIHKSRDR